MLHTPATRSMVLSVALVLGFLSHLAQAQLVGPFRPSMARPQAAASTPQYQPQPQQQQQALRPVPQAPRPVPPAGHPTAHPTHQPRPVVVYLPPGWQPWPPPASPYPIAPGYQAPAYAQQGPPIYALPPQNAGPGYQSYRFPDSYYANGNPAPPHPTPMPMTPEPAPEEDWPIGTRQRHPLANRNPAARPNPDAVPTPAPVADGSKGLFARPQLMPVEPPTAPIAQPAPAAETPHDTSSGSPESRLAMPGKRVAPREPSASEGEMAQTPATQSPTLQPQRDSQELDPTAPGNKGLLSRRKPSRNRPQEVSISAAPQEDETSRLVKEKTLEPQNAAPALPPGSKGLISSKTAPKAEPSPTTVAAPKRAEARPEQVARKPRKPVVTSPPSETVDSPSSSESVANAAPPAAPPAVAKSEPVTIPLVVEASPTIVVQDSPRAAPERSTHRPFRTRRSRATETAGKDAARTDITAKNSAPTDNHVASRPLTQADEPTASEAKSSSAENSPQPADREQPGEMFYDHSPQLAETSPSSDSDTSNSSSAAPTVAAPLAESSPTRPTPTTAPEPAVVVNRDPAEPSTPPEQAPTPAQPTPAAIAAAPAPEHAEPQPLAAPSKSQEPLPTKVATTRRRSSASSRKADTEITSVASSEVESRDTLVSAPRADNPLRSNPVRDSQRSAVRRTANPLR